MDFFSWRTNRTQKITLSDNARVIENFKPGVVFTLGKSDQKRRIVETPEHDKGWSVARSCGVSRHRRS